MTKFKIQLIIAEIIAAISILTVYVFSNAGLAFCVAKIIHRSFFVTHFVTHLTVTTLYLLSVSFKNLKKQFVLVNAVTDKKLTIDLASEPTEELTPVQRPVTGTN